MFLPIKTAAGVPPIIHSMAILWMIVLSGLIGVAPLRSEPKPGQPYCPAQFQQDARALLNQPEYAQAHWGILLQAVDEKILLSHNADQSFIPASNQKLITTAVGLAQLGADFQFQTPIYRIPVSNNSQRLAVLQLIGQGDPTLQVEDLAHVALELQQAGITHVERLQVVDKRSPVNQRRPSWEWDDLLYSYAPAVNDAILADNQVQLTLTPQTPGQPLQVQWSDSLAGEQWQVINQTQTQSTPEASLRIQIRWGTQQLWLTGGLSPDAEPRNIAIAIPNPGQYFLDSWHQQLEQHQIQVNQAEVVLEAEPVSVTPWQVLASPTLAELIVAINQNSDNLYAETVWNRLQSLPVTVDQPTESPVSQNVIEQQLQQWQINPSTLRLKDGSGLSRQNLVSPRQLVQLLLQMSQSQTDFHNRGSVERNQQIFRDSLALAGESGTLSRRFIDTPLAARLWGKTGTLTGVVSLSGYLETLTEDEIIFSILVNNSLASSATIRVGIDTLLNWSAQVQFCDTTAAVPELRFNGTASNIMIRQAFTRASISD